MASDNLQLTDLTSAELEKTNKVNQIFQELEDGLLESTTINLPNADVTMTDAQFNRFMHYTITSTTFTADRVLQIPARKKFFIVKNEDDSAQFRLRVRIGAAGALVTMFPGSQVILYTDGTTIWRVGGSDSDWLVGAGLSGNWTNTGGVYNNYSIRSGAPTGEVWLRGVVKNTVDTFPTGNQVAQLPVGLRPTATVLYVVPDISGAGVQAEVTVTLAGIISVTALPSADSTAGIVLDGIILR